MKSKILNFILIALVVVLAIYVGWAQAYTMLLIYYCVIEGKKQSHFLNPFYLLTLTLFSFVIYNEEIGGIFMMPLSDEVKWMIVGSFTMVIVGLKVGTNFTTRAKKVGCYVENYWVIFWVGLIPTLLAVYLYGNVLDMSGDAMMDAKEKMVLPGLGQLLYFLPASIIVACKKNNTKLIILSTTMALWAAYLTVTKTAIMVVMVFLLVGLISFRPSIVENKVAKFFRAYAVILVPVFLLYTFMGNTTKRLDATNVSTNSIQKAESTLKYDSDFADGMFSNYLYLSAAWSNVEYNVVHNKVTGDGRNTIWQFARKVGVDYDKTEKIEPFTFNVHTYITDWYLDFGYFGPIVMSLFLGMFVFFCYKKFCLSDDPLYIAFYAIVAEATLMMFFSNHFNGGSVLNYFITFIGYSFFARTFKKDIS